ncbi:MAG TPA: glycine--tRNA ligase subunit beta [Stellaceae bacterium]|nr:glycine--tRNA ligase subunit beta [Stellaceae bacterium]
MPNLLLELLTEEIPARMQARAAEDLARLAGEKLAAAGLASTAIRTYVTPRRLTLTVEGLPEAQPDVTEERRGPRVGAPENAVQGFLKSAGVAALAECEQRDTGKGVFYFAIVKRSGKRTAEVLPELLRAILLDIPWPKSMRFPAASFRWVRPIASVLCLFGGKSLAIALDDIPTGDRTRGHRFLSRGEFPVSDFGDYQAKLRAAHVILDPAERRAMIAEALGKTASSLQVTLRDDPALLDEVSGLVEWPVVLAGSIDPAFMKLPPEVLTTSMRSHQKYFACLDAKGALAPRFLIVSNMVTGDGGKVVVAGNERVLRARLSDARFFWEQDRKATLSSRVPKLRERVFYKGLGTMEDKVTRLQALAVELARYIPGDHAEAVRSAAFLSKADLSTGMVGEFPELQGVMGRYYALHDGEERAVADAIAEHYSPLGPNDRCPTAPVSVAVALADKIDTLVGFFSIGETPTGSKDPFALRRAALGVIRLILENSLRVPLAKAFHQAFILVAESAEDRRGREPTRDLLAFFADRLKVHLREKGVRHDLITAVFALAGEDDLVRLLSRVAALGKFLGTEDGANLLVAYRRAANILRIEETRDKVEYKGPADRHLLEGPYEKALAEDLASAAAKADAALKREAFDEAVTALASLRKPVDEFFNNVTVNVTANPELRSNRLRLLSEIRATLNAVADFSEIEG